MIGRPVRRREDERMLRGRAQYLDDIAPDGAVFIAFVRSTEARARIAAIDAPPATTLITADHLAGRARPVPLLVPHGVEVADAAHPLLAEREVRYVGQPIAAVVAPSRAAAEDALEHIVVDYEPYDAEPQQLLRWHKANGDVDAAFAAAAHVTRTRHAIPRAVAAPIEPRGCIAHADGDVLRMWLSAQDPHRPLAGLAHALDRPPESIRLTLADVGGAFGSKGAIPPEAVVTAIAALDLGVPVKWVETRTENFLAAYQGRGVEGEVELALDADGRMLALRARLTADTGAYLHPATAVPPHTLGMLITGAYDIAAVDVEIVGARTDRVPTGPMRGAGRPEACFLLERTVDAAARELGVDPVALRRRNLIRAFPYETPLGFTYDSGDYEQCLTRALELVGDKPAGRRVGLGVAVYVERAGGQFESAQMTRADDGRVIVHSSSFPHGQGHDTTWAQIVADRLGIAIEDVELRFGGGGPAGVGTFGGRSVAMAGSAIAVAADRLAAGERTATVRFDSPLVFGSGAYAAIVEIDEETGQLTVHRIAAVDDAGRIINPLLAEGQVVGGTIHGLGTVLTEEMAFDEGDQPVSASFVNYAMLSAGEQPPIATAFVETPTPLNPLGAKGVGEAGTIGAPAAIANAVTDALGGRWVDPPFTPEKLWRAAARSPAR
ncbi:MAG TPA: xanthine dehydrogenase family protein molybdopterin-binding subunit [Solirubrobacteraceae bacterium]|nr:xanthine dehydrogenase family protein molybdopterin-binding subunit [Solirubrobacteraceae bacterium]